MTLRSGKTSISGGISCDEQAAVPGFAPKKSKPSLSFRGSPDAGTFNERLLGQWAIPAGNTQQVDFRTFESIGGSVTAQRAIGLCVQAEAEAAGGEVKLAPSALNPLTWFFGSATDSITLNVPGDGTDCGLVLLDGSAATVSNAACNMDLVNTGSVEVTVRLLAILGT